MEICGSAKLLWSSARADAGLEGRFCYREPYRRTDPLDDHKPCQSALATNLNWGEIRDKQGPHNCTGPDSCLNCSLFFGKLCFSLVWPGLK